MKKGLVLFVLLLCQIANAQDRIIGCQVILDYDYGEYIDVFYQDSNNYFPFAKVKNDLDREVIMVMDLTGKTDEFFRVNIKSGLFYDTFELSDVYVHKEHLVILSRLLEHPMPLFSEPSKNSSVVMTIPNSYGYVYKVLDCDGNWLKVEYTDEDKKCHIGWMAPEYQCSNPYSACMGM